MERFAYFAPDCPENRDIWRTPPDQYFSCCGGPLLITVDSGLQVRVGSNPELCSVQILVERTEDGAVAVCDPLCDDSGLYCFSALDPTYSSDLIRAFLGKRIEKFRLLRVVGPDASAEDRPCEAGLILVFPDGSELLLAHGLHDGSDDFSVITPDMIDPKLKHKLKEIRLDL